MHATSAPHAHRALPGGACVSPGCCLLLCEHVCTVQQASWRCGEELFGRDQAYGARASHIDGHRKHRPSAHATQDSGAEHSTGARNQRQEAHAAHVARLLGSRQTKCGVGERWFHISPRRGHVQMIRSKQCVQRRGHLLCVWQRAYRMGGTVPAVVLNRGAPVRHTWAVEDGRTRSLDLCRFAEGEAKLENY